MSDVLHTFNMLVWHLCVSWLSGRYGPETELPSRISRIWPRLSITYHLALVLLALGWQSPMGFSIFEEPLWTLIFNFRNTTRFCFQPAHSPLISILKNTHTCSCLSPPPTATSIHTPRHAPIKWWQLLVVENSHNWWQYCRQNPGGIHF